MSTDAKLSPSYGGASSKLLEIGGLPEESNNGPEFNREAATRMMRDLFPGAQKLVISPILTFHPLASWSVGLKDIEAAALPQMVRTEARPAGADLRRFECRKCKQVDNTLAEDPLKSNKAGWLNGALKPPE